MSFMSNLVSPIGYDARDLIRIIKFCTSSAQPCNSDAASRKRRWFSLRAGSDAVSSRMPIVAAILSFIALRVDSVCFTATLYHV